MSGYGAGTYGGGLYGGAEPGVRLLPEIPAGVVAVEIAWGADLSDTNGSGWTWTDVTTDVRIADGLSFSLGRGDEAARAQPATLTLKLDNSTSRYSLGGRSPNWPNVRRNTPVRVRVDPGDGTLRVAFQGYANGFTPSWDSPGGTVPVATLSASGVMRRLAQGSDPLRSALYRYHTLNAAPAEYWPLEEGTAATQAAPAVPGGAPGTFAPTVQSGTLYGKVAWGGDTDNPATERAVQVSAGGVLTLPTRPTLFSSYWAVTWSMRYTGGSGAKMFFGSALDYPSIGATFYTDGSVEFDYVTGALSSTALLTYAQGDHYLWDNVWHDWAFVWQGTSAALYRDGTQVATYSGASAYFPLTYVEFEGVPNPGGTEDPTTAAHVAVWSSAPSFSAVSTAAHAYTGEAATDRLTRLCGEEHLALALTGSSVSLMGPQTPTSLLDLLFECEDVDLGILYDGAGPGLSYVARDQRENGTVDLTLDGDQLAAPFAPTDDDQRDRNRVTATGASGAKASFEDATGPKGTAAIGVYDSSFAVNLGTDADLPSYAAWQVHLGTVEGYRYPVLTLDMRCTPILAASVLACAPSSRVLVQNVGAALASVPAEDVDVLVEGVAMMLSPYGWTVTLKCSPFSPWVIGTVAAEAGDTSSTLIRLDTDGSTAPYVHNPGDLGLYAATSSGSLWTTAADDFPLLLDVGGVQVRATACTGTSSPQVFTTDPLPQAVPVGTPIAVWNPPVLGL